MFPKLTLNLLWRPIRHGICDLSALVPHVSGIVGLCLPTLLRSYIMVPLLTWAPFSCYIYFYRAVPHPTHT